MYKVSEYDEVWVIAGEEDKIVFKKGRKWVEGKTLPKSEIWGELPDGSRFEIKNKHLRHRSEVPAFMRLWRQTGGFEVTPGWEEIPLDVAMQGKAAIAVYLGVVGQLTREEVAEKMGVKEGTIRTYVSEYKQGKR